MKKEQWRDCFERAMEEVEDSLLQNSPKESEERQNRNENVKVLAPAGKDTETSAASGFSRNIHRNFRPAVAAAVLFLLLAAGILGGRLLKQEASIAVLEQGTSQPTSPGSITSGAGANTSQAPGQENASPSSPLALVRAIYPERVHVTEDYNSPAWTEHYHEDQARRESADTFR